jgi:hypothetical protein
VKWNFGGSKYSSGTKSESVGAGFRDSIVTTKFDFKGKSAASAIWEEILETATSDFKPPPGFPRSIAESNGQQISLPLTAEFAAPSK